MLFEQSPILFLLLGLLRLLASCLGPLDSFLSMTNKELLMDEEEKEELCVSFQKI
jgi:hypothetical protein